MAGGITRIEEMFKAIRGTRNVGVKTVEELEGIAKGGRGLKTSEFSASLEKSRDTLRLASREEEAAVVEVGGKEAKKLVEDRLAGKIGEAEVAAEMKVAEKGMWDNVKDFAKVLGMEALKGLAMGIGFEAAAAVWHKAAELLTGSEKDEFQRKIDACNKANEVLPKILDDWNHWLTTHYSERDSFGTVEAPGTTINISKFLTFQVSKSALYTIQTEEIAPTLAQAARAINTVGVVPLVEKLKKLSAEMLKVAKSITTDYQAMQAKELKDHTSEIQGVLDKLNAA